MKTKQWIFRGGAALLCYLLYACASPAVRDRTHEYGKPFPGTVELMIERQKSSAVHIDAQFKAIRDTANAQYKFVMSIMDATLVIIHPDKGVVDSTRLSVATSVTGFTDKDSVMVEASGGWNNDDAIAYSRLIFHFILKTTSGEYHLAQERKLPSVDGEEPLEFLTITPAIDEQTDSSITFAMAAKRNRGQTIDYHPNGEKFRVEIFTPKDVLVFSSQHGMNFTQDIQPVEPRIKGSVHRYTYTWMGTDNNGNPLPSGTYKAVLTIVAQPKPSVATLEFDWKGKTK